jgi:hypothetical protein
MNRILSKTNRIVTAANIFGSILGLLGLSIIASTQAIAAIAPLLFAPTVFGIFGVLLYVSQPNTKQLEATVRPTPQPVQR